MNDLIGPLGLPGALAALVLALERGFAFARTIHGMRNGNGHKAGLDLVEVRESLARLEAGFEARIRTQEEETRLLREQGTAIGSRIAARCEEIIDPLRKQIEHLERRVDGIAQRRRG